MTITVLYRTEVQVPEKVAEAFRLDQHFIEDTAAAIRGADHSGIYGPPGEMCIWAEDPMLSKVQRIDAALYAMLALYQLRLEALHDAD